MKPIFLFLLSLTLSFGVNAREKAPANLYTSYTGFDIPAEPVLPAHETHPSLWFNADDVPALIARLSADDFASRRWAAIEKLADLSSPLPAAPAATDKTETIHKYYGAVSIAARAHALVALLSSDATNRAAHLKRAKELLLRAYDGPIFQLDSKKQGSPVDEIYRGSWLQNYAAAYDCIQPNLDRATDEEIRARLAREAQCVYDNLYAWTPTSPHNHLSKPAWGLGSMALALSSDPHAKAWLGRAIEAANKNTRYFFSGDGLYREGSHYLIFSLTNFLPFLYHYRNVSGVDAFPEFQPVFEAMVEARNSHGWLPNIEDSYIRPTPTHLAATAYRNARTRLHSSAPLAEVLTWSYATCDLKPFEKERGDTGLNYTGASWDYPLEIDELLTHDATIRATAPDVAPNIFLAGGQSFLRDSWSNRGAGQRYLLFHGVAVADNHNHDDQLSFILEAEGQMMCSDSGYSRGTYTGAERSAWYNKAPAHNTLTLDGLPADQQPGNVTPPQSHFEQAGLVGVQKQTDLPKGAKWARAVFWIAGDYYVVVDRVALKQPGELKSYLHGGRGTLTTSDGEHTWHYSADPYGPAASLRCWIAAPGATTAVKQGELTYIKGDYAEFPYLETTSSRYSAPWITLLKPTAAQESAPFAVQDRSTATLAAFVVTAADHRTLIAARAPSEKTISLDDVETDASLVIIRRNLAGKTLNRFVSDATYLRVGGKQVWPAAAATTSQPANQDRQVLVPSSPAPSASGAEPYQLNPAELTALAAAAPAALRAPIATVVDKPQPSPTGDAHDYVSFARYYWPDPDRPKGLPFVRHDGRHNKAQVALGDHKRLWDFAKNVEKLAAAWRVKRDEAAARRAGEWLRAWFIEPATKMNPNLNYAQIRLGHDRNQGSPSGVLDARSFGQVIDALLLLHDSPAFAPSDEAAIQAWYKAYLGWLTSAKNARAEHAAKNNHGSWFLAQVIPIARYVGRDDLARQLCEEDKKRIAAQIRPDGRQPEEINRADGLSYSRFNLEAQFHVVRLARGLGIDLWNYTAPNGASLHRALDFLRPFNAKPESWPTSQNAKLPPGFLDDLISEAAAFSAPASPAKN